MPLALKDVFTTRGMPTTAGSKILEGWRPPYDATVTRGCARPALVILGKTNMDEFAMGSSTENSAYGPTHNPWDLARIPGGSSGGSSAAVAAYEAPLAIGTDTGGSIRQPAAVTGIVGVKPTYGGSSRYGLVAFASSLDTPGPFARNVLDAALLHEAIAGHDPMRLHLHRRAGAAPWSPPARERRRDRACGSAWSRSSAATATSPACSPRFDEAVELLESLGAEVVEVSCPHFDYALPAYYLIAPSECSSNLARFDAMRYGLRVGDDGTRSAEEVMALTREAGLRRRGQAPHHPRHLRAVQRLLRRLLRPGAEGPHADRPRLRRRRSSRSTCWSRRPRRRRRSRSASAPTTRWRCTSPTCAPSRPTWRATRPSRCPCGLADEDGLPVGLQIMAPALADDRLYRVGAAVEKALEARWGGSLLSKAPAL